MANDVADVPGASGETVGLTGWVSAGISGSQAGRPIIGNVIGGLAAMALTWGIGRLFDVTTG